MALRMASAEGALTELESIRSAGNGRRYQFHGVRREPGLQWPKRICLESCPQGLDHGFGGDFTSGGCGRAGSGEGPLCLLYGGAGYSIVRVR
jgi:hypothetical protein